MERPDLSFDDDLLDDSAAFRPIETGPPETGYHPRLRALGARFVRDRRRLQMVINQLFDEDPPHLASSNSITETLNLCSDARLRRYIQSQWSTPLEAGTFVVDMDHQTGVEGAMGVLYQTDEDDLQWMYLHFSWANELEGVWDFGWVEQGAPYLSDFVGPHKDFPQGLYRCDHPVTMLFQSFHQRPLKKASHVRSHVGIRVGTSDHSWIMGCPFRKEPSFLMDLSFARSPLEAPDPEHLVVDDLLVEPTDNGPEKRELTSRWDTWHALSDHLHPHLKAALLEHWIQRDLPVLKGRPVMGTMM